MKNRILLSFAFLLLVYSKGFCAGKDPVSVKVETKSLTNKISTACEIDALSRNASIITVSITNKGSETEFIKNIEIQINSAYSLTDSTQVYFGGYEMDKAPIIKRGASESANTESVLMIKENNKTYFKAGILSWEVFRPVISINKAKKVIISADGENKPIKPGETLKFEKIVLEKGESWQDMLYSYGHQIAKANNIAPKQTNYFKGWATYDYYGGNFTEHEIKLNIEQLKALNVDANLIQIDGGWWAERGDYLTPRSNITGGMKAVAQLITENGYIPGIHIDGFRAEVTSNVFKQHPDWFLRDQDNKPIIADYLKNGKIVQRVYFDYSNPVVRDYMKNTLKTMREDWGFQYFKIDFTWFGLNDRIFKSVKNDTLTEVRAFDPNMTSMERTRAGLKAMGEGIDTAFYLGCSSVFGSNIGIVDGLRTGGDISPVYELYASRCLQNACNFYLHKTVVFNDADYIVVRNKDDEEAERAWGKNKFGGTVTHNEAIMWTNYVTLFGGIKLSSDNLKTLRDERKTLVKEAFEIKTCDKFIPIDFWDKAKGEEDAYNIILGSNQQGVYLALFNWNNHELGIKLSNIPTENIQLVNCNEQPTYKTSANELDIKLKARTSVIFKIQNNANFELIRKQIQYELYKL